MLIWLFVTLQEIYFWKTNAFLSISSSLLKTKVMLHWIPDYFQISSVLHFYIYNGYRKSSELILEVADQLLPEWRANHT